MKYKMKTAIISVSDKRNIQNIASFLLDNDYNIISSGGTYTKLQSLFTEEHLRKRITKVQDLTGFPEILNGRVKTLHPKIHGGILARIDHQSDLDTHNIPFISVVVVNLYPFQKVVSNNPSNESVATEHIDIGGHTLIRAAAKNYSRVLVVTNPDQYDNIINNYKFEDSEQIRKDYSLEAWDHITNYDIAIANYFQKNNVVYRKYTQTQQLKYGCNPQQSTSAIHSINNNIVPFELINGNAGYINILDAVNSWQLVYELGSSLSISAAASFKHTSPAGVGVSNGTQCGSLTPTLRKMFCLKPDINYNDVSIAYIRARNVDPMSSFGDFIAIYGKVEVETAKLIKREVSDGIIALDYSDEALDILKSKKRGNYIILKGKPMNNEQFMEYREIYGICLSQEVNKAKVQSKSLLNNIKTKNVSISETDSINLDIANISLKYAQSNSVAYAYDGQLVGLGAGQQSRVDCVKLAGRKTDIWFLRQHPKVLGLFDFFVDGVKRQQKINATIRYIEGDFTSIEKEYWNKLFTKDIEPLTQEEKTRFLNQQFGVALASDAFFPFRDSIDHCSKRGVSCIIQPGGSIADEQIIEACNEYNMSMVFSGSRLFTH